MNKNVIIGILFIICAGLSIFVVWQNSQIDEKLVTCEREKEELVKTAQEQQQAAREFQKMAELARNEAMVQRALAEAQIEELKKKK